MFANEYTIAWTIYVVAGIGCCVVWWKITSYIGNRLLRDMLRGLAVVIVFTPWYAGTVHRIYAPAIVILMLDVMLTGAKSGLRGGVALLVMTFLM
ncbi:MAG TPA: hypothetical protein VJ998_00430 [Pseudomonadales bacterium]|nr:hypothetical protein [Pseudomonadales bacterium]